MVVEGVRSGPQGPRRKAKTVKPRKHLVIPDLQVRPGVSTEHLPWIANLAIEERPEVILQIGDWADMSSLSAYDVGTKAFEGRRIKADITAANDALKRFTEPIHKEIARRVNLHKTRWEPELEETEGNHEHRILKAINLDPKLEDLIHPADIKFREYGFNVTPFLQVKVIDGVAYSHYFASGIMGRPITTARQLLLKKHMSCFAGHQQGRDVAYAQRADGKEMTAIICGSCYLHDEPYLNAQTNKHFRGVYLLKEVEDGCFSETPITLTELQEKYS